jgi:hypothetical protein
MWENTLTPVKGWFDESSLDKRAKLNATILTSATAVPSGRVAVLDSVGQFVIAGYSGTGGVVSPTREMPIFLWQGTKDTDVQNNGVPTGGAYSIATAAYWYGLSPTGYMSGLVATGGYELQTTEFEPVADAGTYVSNDLLSITKSATLASAGKLTRRLYTAADTVSGYPTAYGSTSWIVGVCSTHVNQKIEDANYLATATGAYAGNEPDAAPTGYNAHGKLTLTFWPVYLPTSTATNSNP